MTRAKSKSGLKRTILTLVMVAVIVNVAMVGYGVFWTWIKSTGYIEQNTVGIKPQEPPGPAGTAPGVVPVTGAPVRLALKSDARELVNPVAPNSASLFRGEENFRLICSPCHGLEGEGHGVMGSVPRLSKPDKEDTVKLQAYLSGFMSYTPDIYDDFTLRLTDGELYWIITNGGEAIMPSFADAMLPEARWDLINYIRFGLGDKSGL